MADLTINSAIGYMGMGETILGGITSIFGDIAQGRAEKNAYDYQAGVARMNAQIAEQNANYATQVGEIQAGAYGYKAAQTLGSIKAVQGSHGLDVRSGSMKQVQESQQLISATDMAAIRSNAAKNAFDYRQQAQGDVAQAEVDTMAGRNAQSAAGVKAASSFIGAASSVDSQWLAGQKSGLWGNGSDPLNINNPLGR
jgi:hypothetical protein